MRESGDERLRKKKEYFCERWVKIEIRGRGCNSCGIYRLLRGGRISGEVGFAGGGRRSGELWGKVGRGKRDS